MRLLQTSTVVFSVLAVTAGASLGIIAPNFIGDTGIPSVTQCNNVLDDDGDTFMDLADPDCQGNPMTASEGMPQAPVPVTQCNNTIDDDGDRFIDLADPDCQGNPALNSEGIPVPPSVITQCNNTMDDDGDTFMDLADPDCQGDPALNSEGIPPPAPAGTTPPTMP
ncbi:MAG: hypothetical protein Q7R81_00715 [Candidatus Peregrinibacteria bacterium]|nr:hypothetical protein [Candidatus Peregrinibacteria bacterium]